MSPIARFEAQVVKRDVTPDLQSMGLTTGCWEWTGNVRKDGYTKITVDNTTLYAHRFAYQHFIGALDSELVIDHRCRNRKCVNPEHLHQVTTKVNNTLPGTPGARRKAITHCPQGHAYEGANLYVSKHGLRHCMTCIRIRGDATRKLKREAKSQAKQLATTGTL